MNKKHKVVHTRLSEELFDMVLKKAKSHGTTVSGLMRNMMNDFLEISENVGDLAEDCLRDNLFKEKDDAIIAFQEIKVHKECTCELSGKKLKPNTKAYLAFFQSGHSGIVSAECYKAETK